MPTRPRSRSAHSAISSIPVVDSPRVPSRLPIYICGAAEIILILGGAICSVPWTRLLESAVCRRSYAASDGVESTPVVLAGSIADLLRGVLQGIGPGAEMDEALCKGDNVQAEMAGLIGSMASFAVMPSLLLTIPYSILAKRIDRRIILVVNTLSSLTAMLFMIMIACYPKSNLRLLWLTGLFDFIGGGGPVFLTLLRSIIAESVEADRLSSVLYTLSSLHTVARLVGVVLGAWLLKYGAASAMLLGVTLTSTIIPILSLLPRSAGYSSKSARSERPSTTLSADCASDGPSNVDSPLLGPERPDAKDVINREHQVKSRQTQPVPTKWSRKTFSSLMRKFSTIPFDNPLFPIFLAIMFLNGLAMDVKGQLRPWTSKRYDWPLATVGYILSVESLLGVGILLALPWLDRVRSPPPQPRTADSPPPADIDDQQFAEEESAAATTRTTIAKRRREILVARISLFLGAGGALILALAADRAAFVIGLAAMTGAVGFPDAIRAFFTSHFATADIQGLYSSVTVVETLSVMVGSPIWGKIYAHAYKGSSEWIGTPFGVCAILLVCTLGLVLVLRV